MRETLTKTLSLIATVIAVTSLGVAGAQPRRATTSMTPGDILRVANVSDAQISPNGQWVVYTVSTVNGDRPVSALWLVRLSMTTAKVPTSTVPPTSQRLPTTDWPDVRSAPTPLLAPGWNASSPRWSPDSSKIAFLANQDDQQGLWIVAPEIANADKREPRFIASVQSTNFFITYAGESFAWAPDSKHVAFISATEESPGPRDALGEGTLATTSVDPRVIDRIQYKSRTSFSDNRRTHVWITAIDKPEPRQLTSGQYYDHAITFSPSGDEIAFLSNHETDPDANNNSDIFAVDLSGQVRQITATNGCEYEPTWSPDGKWIAYTATKRDITTIDSVAEDTHVWVTNAAGSSRRELTADLDRRARNLRWSPQSRSIYFLAGDRGRTNLYAVRLDGGPVRNVFSYEDPTPNPRPEPATFAKRPFQINSFSINSQSIGTLALVLSDSLNPTEVWTAPASFGRVMDRLSPHNDSLARSVSLIEPEEMTFKSFDGTRIQAWLMKPAGWRADRKYPLILSIHGGPHGMFGWGFNPTFQVYAAGGYAVLYLNPRGSSGYGQKFSDGTLNEWGGGDYKDLMAGVDEALRKYPWIDQNRMGVTGGSYGGFMTNWIITQTPRFKAAVSAASVSNLISFYSTSLYQDLIHAEFGGFPWDNYDLLWQWSPLRYVKQTQTPTLFIHREQDNDVHITQAEEMYTALKRRGVETVLVRYPREGHGLREAKHRVDALERTLAWFDRYLK
jgi:dipeptidyl aminopeptidase/acylaminoacyl peptidase